MVQSGHITLYTHGYSPFCHRVHIALEEAKADYTAYTLNIMNKPSWYNEKVNPTTGKIPAITYGGPKTDPENPSPDSVKLNESLVINELIAETFPEAQLHPKDLVQRARARIFISVWETKGHEAYVSFLLGAKPYTALLDALAELQSLLPETGFAVGDWSMADAAIGPFLVRIKVNFAHEFGKYPLGEGKKGLDELNGPRFTRLMKYLEDVQQRPSFKKTWDEALYVDVIGNNPYLKRD